MGDRGRDGGERDGRQRMREGGWGRESWETEDEMGERGIGKGEKEEWVREGGRGGQVSGSRTESRCSERL